MAVVRSMGICKPLEKAITKYQKEISNRMKGTNLGLSRVKVTTKEIRISRLCSISRRVMSETPRVLATLIFIFSLWETFLIFVFLFFLMRFLSGLWGIGNLVTFLKTKIKAAES